MITRQARTIVARATMQCVVPLVFSFYSALSRGDISVVAPTPHGLTQTSTVYPFLIKQTTPFVTFPSMRYQQVYDASLFTNVDSSLIYLTTLTFSLGASSGADAWTVTNMQVNLSTTARSADHLSTNFSENVGSDDLIVLGPGSYSFPGGGPGAQQLVAFDRPFRYRPGLGNLLIDVRIFDGRGIADARAPGFRAYSSSVDESSRVYATNVNAAMATAVDSTGLSSAVQFSPIPSLQSQFFPVYLGSLSNYIIISWPSQPSAFVLQKSAKAGLGAIWQPVTNKVFGSVSYGGRWIELPASNAGPAAFFRLIWPGGQGPVGGRAVPGESPVTEPAKLKP